MVRQDPILDSRRLHQFVVAVDAGTLSAAADELFLTQQAISASIRQLERDLQVPLFDRTRRRLHLTRAGHVLYEGATTLLAGNASLVDSVRREAGGGVRPYVIGHSPAISSAEVYRLIEPAIAALPSQPITARQVFPHEFADLLIGNEIDLAVRRGVDATPNLASSVIAYHDLRVAVVRGHPLASRTTLSVADIVDVPIVVWAPERRSFYTQFLVSYCRHGGFEPTLIVNEIQGTPPFTAVQRYPHACAFVTDPVGDLDGGEVRVIPFVDPPSAPVQAVWLPHTHSEVRSTIISGQR